MGRALECSALKPACVGWPKPRAASNTVDEPMTIKTESRDVHPATVPPVSEDFSAPEVISPVPGAIDVETVVRDLRGTETGTEAENQSPAAAFGMDVGVRELRQGRSTIPATACPVCHSSRARPKFAISGLTARIVVCADCGLGRLDPQPSAEEIRTFYPAEYYGAPGAKFSPLVESMVRFVGGRHVRMMSHGLRPQARVLDVGCGRGVLLGALADRGFEVHGFEISETAAAGADPRATIRIAERLSDADYPSGYFDQVILWHVLEHLPDPRETVAEIHRILRPGGRIVVAVPNFSSWQARWAGAAWFHLDPPRHLFHFPAKALRQLLLQGGFDCLGEHHFSLRQNPFGWLQSAMNRIPVLPRNGIYRLLHRAQQPMANRFDWPTRLKLFTLTLLGAAPAVALSVLAASLRSGATVTIVAQSRGSRVPPSPGGTSEFAEGESAQDASTPGLKTAIS